MSEKKSLCVICGAHIWCPTWAEVKCTAKKQRIYDYKEVTECSDYRKLPTNWKPIPCGCEDCQKNEMLMEGCDEEG